MALLTSSFIFFKTKSILEQKLQDKFSSIVSILSMNLKYEILVKDVEKLSSYAKNVMQDKEIEYMEIIDANNKVIIKFGKEPVYTKKVNDFNEILTKAVNKPYVISFADNYSFYSTVSDFGSYKTEEEDKESLVFQMPAVEPAQSTMKSIGMIKISVTKSILKREIFILLGFSFLMFSFITVLGVFFLYSFLLRTVFSPIDMILKKIKEMSEGEGDLTKMLDIVTQDEIGELAKYFNKFLHAQRLIIKNIFDTANTAAMLVDELVSGVDKVNVTTQQISISADEMAKGGHALTGMTVKTKKEIGKLNTHISTVAQSNIETRRNANEVTQAAQEGMVSANTARQKIEAIKKRVAGSSMVVSELKAKSEQIHQVIEVINIISKQTNLLSLNAAIEAARAGEHGRGFSVVADEVRKLAESTNEAISQIKEIINEIIIGTDNVVASMSQETLEVDEGAVVVRIALAQLELIAGKVSILTNKFSNIESATREQVEIANDVIKNIDKINSFAESSAASSEEVSVSLSEINSVTEVVASVSDRLARDTNELLQTVNRFKI